MARAMRQFSATSDIIDNYEIFPFLYFQSQHFKILNTCLVKLMMKIPDQHFVLYY